jgi:hypothetical protein
MQKLGISGHLWPVHLKPLPDELLSSWIVRLAAAHGLKLHTFCTLAWPRKQIWNTDIDKHADDEFLRVLVEKTATPWERARETTLQAYEGVLYETHNPHGNTRWILPLGIYHRQHRSPGLQFCPQCLAEDPEPYFRRSWRLACTTICVRHDTALLDRCPECGATVNIHRGERGDRNKWIPDPITYCHACRFDLALAADAHEAATMQECAYQRELECSQQRQLAKHLRDGWVRIPNHGPVHSHLYFTGLRQLVRLLAGGKTQHSFHGTKGRRFHRAVCQRYGVEPFTVSFAPGAKDVERLEVTDRRRVLSLALLLLTDWPDGFVDVCEEEGVWSSTLLRDMRSAPFWYSNVVHEYLERSTYHASMEEIAWGFARSHQLPGGSYRPPERRVRVEWIGKTGESRPR